MDSEDRLQEEETAGYLWANDLTSLEAQMISL